MFYKVTIVSFPGHDTVYEHATLDAVFELMREFKNVHPGCRMFRPFCDSSIAGLLAWENNDCHGLIVEEAG